MGQHEKVVEHISIRYTIGRKKFEDIALTCADSFEFSAPLTLAMIFLSSHTVQPSFSQKCSHVLLVIRFPVQLWAIYTVLCRVNTVSFCMCDVKVSVFMSDAPRVL